MDDFEEDPPVRTSPAKLSRTPSWVMLGFLLGALFVWSLPHLEKAPASPPPVVAAPAPSPRIISPPRIAVIEALFFDWGRFAAWEHDLTEVAAFNPETGENTDFFEVYRSNGNFYFRSIPAFTRPLLTHGVPPQSLLQFTETEERRQQWLREISEETWKSFSGAVRDTVGRKPMAKETSPAPSAPISTSQP